ncbi:Trafficking protein particle complex subunit 6B [Hondaea fermentalgiana]|uniref:Trafficking protein particle complex subunit 6B n=1 Tax=Hondaea fermentalgiana TaxID=2315210 RepID=A0A2R5GFW0_9STRA|nr:Trafficking protein particle complex subunit 6B [Hondaea fermentalgiana]|eukprot:GBG29219.1 Trafficking protein particle complex subunit 6B [Hondaea fermentalgiana]
MATPSGHAGAPPPPGQQQEEAQQGRSQTPQPDMPQASLPARPGTASAASTSEAAQVALGVKPTAASQTQQRRMLTTPKARSGASQSRGPMSAIAYRMLAFELVRICDAQNDLGKLEMLGFGIGHRFVERFTRTHAKFTNTLEVVKFLCKDLWLAMFGKQVDKLQTNHKGVFVLHDNKCAWVSSVDIDYSDEESLEQAKKFLIAPCGLIRGALSNLGIKCTVRAEFSTLPMCFFNIQINEEML